MNDLEKLLNAEDKEQQRQGLLELLNLLAEVQAENERLQAENQALRDEINRLKGEQGKPKIGGGKGEGGNRDYSSERERRQVRGRRKGSKVKGLAIDRVEVLRLARTALPVDAEFKGYQRVVVQDIRLERDNIVFQREKYYAASTGRAYIAALPGGYGGQFGPGVKALALILYYLGQMTQPRIKMFLASVGCQISAGQVSQLLVKRQEKFHREKNAVYEAGLRSSPWQHIDETVMYEAKETHYTHIVCNSLYTSYHTLPRKDRLSVLDVLRNRQPRQYRLNGQALQIMNTLGLSQKTQQQMSRLPRDHDFNEDEFTSLLESHQLKLGPQQRRWILSAAAVAAYHSQKEWPVVKLLICDEAGQYKAITEKWAACWVHDGRHYKKLITPVPLFQQEVDEFLDAYWQFYHHLVAFREYPSHYQADYLRQEFDTLFARQYRYRALNKRIGHSRARKHTLLQILNHPEILPHNNPAELAARQRVRKRKISYGTQGTDGTQAWDTFLSLMDTTRKLGVSFYRYIFDRIQDTYDIPPLAQLVTQQAAHRQFDASWTNGIPDLPASY